MTSYDPHEFSRGHLTKDGFLPQHPASMALSAPSGISVSLPNPMAYQHGHYNTSDYFTPRTIAPHPGYFPAFHNHGYPQGETYAISSNSTSVRGRSGSGASTASVSYSVARPRTPPTSPHLFGGA